MRSSAAKRRNFFPSGRPCSPARHIHSSAAKTQKLHDFVSPIITGARQVEREKKDARGAKFTLGIRIALQVECLMDSIALRGFWCVWESKAHSDEGRRVLAIFKIGAVLLLLLLLAERFQSGRSRLIPMIGAHPLQRRRRRLSLFFLPKIRACRSVYCATASRLFFREKKQRKQIERSGRLDIYPSRPGVGPKWQYISVPVVFLFFSPLSSVSCPKPAVLYGGNHITTTAVAILLECLTNSRPSARQYGRTSLSRSRQRVCLSYSSFYNVISTLQRAEGGLVGSF